MIDNLDAALAVISEIADRYAEHTPQRQRDIPKQMVKRVIIDPEGRIIHMELKPPFNYLETLAKGGANGKQGKGSSAGTKRTSTQAGSLQITRSDPGRIRTCDQEFKRLLRYHCATGPESASFYTNSRNFQPAKTPLRCLTFLSGVFRFEILNLPTFGIIKHVVTRFFFLTNTTIFYPDSMYSFHNRA